MNSRANRLLLAGVSGLLGACVVPVAGVVPPGAPVNTHFVVNDGDANAALSVRHGAGGVLHCPVSPCTLQPPSGNAIVSVEGRDVHYQERIVIPPYPSQVTIRRTRRPRQAIGGLLTSTGLLGMTVGTLLVTLGTDKAQSNILSGNPAQMQEAERMALGGLGTFLVGLTVAIPGVALTAVEHRRLPTTIAPWPDGARQPTLAQRR